MGAYVNPENESKESWLQKNAVLPDFYPTWDTVPEGQLAVCLVNNGPFTAAGIAFSEAEFKVFADPKDRRGKVWFFCDVEKLYAVSNLEKYLPKVAP
jgi:hypothetical protein